MNKSELVTAITNATTVKRKHVAEIIDALMDTVADTLKNGDEVLLVGFGTFRAKELKARTGRNPKTGAVLQIKARRVPRFSAGKKLKEAVA